MSHFFQTHRAQIPVAGIALYLAMSVTELPNGLALAALVFAGLYTTFFPAGSPTAPKTPQRYLLPALALFLASFALSTYFSYYRPVSTSALSSLLPGLLIAWILWRSNSGSVVFVHCGAIMAAAVVVIYLMIGWRSGWMHPEEAMEYFRTTALIVPNDVVAAVILFPTLAGVIALPRFRRARLAALVIALIALPVLWWVGSRLSLLTLLMTILMYYLAVGRMRLVTVFKGVALFTAAACIAALIITNSGAGGGRFAVLDNTRLSVWAAGISRWQDKPWVGVGPGHFEVPYRLGILDLQLPDWVMIEQRMVPWAHNIYLEAYLERGVIGLGTQLVLFLLVLAVLHGRWRSTDGDTKALNLAVLLAYCAFLFAGLFELTFQRLWVGNLFFLFVGAALAPMSTESARPTTPQ